MACRLTTTVPSGVHAPTTSLDPRQTSARLQALTAALSGTLREVDVARVLMSEGVAAVGASQGAVTRLSEDGEWLELLATLSVPEENTAAFTRFPNDKNSSGGYVAQTREPLFIECADDYVARFPTLRDVVRRSETQAEAAFPLMVGERVIGTLHLDFHHARQFSEQDREFYQTMARLCAQALDRAQLFESERTGADLLARSDASLRLTLEGARVIAWEWEMGSGKFRVTGNNRALFGSDIFDAQAAVRAIHPDDRELHAQSVRNAIRNRRAYRVEYRIVRPDDGMIVFAEERGVPLCDESGNVLSITGVTTDVSDQRRADAEREALLASERAAHDRLAIATHAAGLGIHDFDMVSGTILWDERCYAAFGLSSRTPVDIELFRAHVHPADLPSVEAAIEQAIATARLQSDGLPTFDAEYRTLGGDGVTRVVHATGVVFFEEPLSAGGERRPVRLIGTVQDVTEQRRVEASERQARHDAEIARAEAERAREEAERANRAKGEFLAVMSHELRTPLNAIGGYAQLIEMEIHGPVTEAQREALARIDRSQRHLLRLINDVLNLARIESGNIDYTLEALDLTNVVAEVVLVIEPLCTKADLTLSVRPPEGDEYPRVIGDRGKVHQVLINLLSNAVKFTPPGGSIVVDFPTRRDGSKTPKRSVRVRDSGPGIPRDRLRDIFEPFVQLHPSPANTPAGVGLGLAISRDLARGMQGELRARSAPGEGAAFTLSLPAAPPAATT